MIKTIESFSLIFEESDIIATDQKKSILNFDSNNTEITIYGNYIEKQFSVDKGFILFVSTDLSNENLSIYYIDKNFKIIDRIDIYSSSPMPMGICLEDIKVLSNNKIYFDFLTVKPWILTLLDKPQKNIFSWRPLCVHRPTKSLFDDVYMAIAHC